MDLKKCWTDRDMTYIFRILRVPWVTSWKKNQKFLYSKKVKKNWGDNFKKTGEIMLKNVLCQNRDAPPGLSASIQYMGFA